MTTKAEKKELIVKKKITIKADVKKVWDALTNPEITKKYFFGCGVYSDWKEGSPLLWKGTYQGKEVNIKGVILKIIPDKLLKYNVWSEASGLPDKPENYTIVTDELSFLNGETTLSVSDENFGHDTGAEKRYLDSDKGWDFVLKGLKELLEKK